MSTNDVNLATERTRLRDYLKRNNIDPLDEREDLPCGLVRNDIVPIRGSIHIATGRVISRKSIDKLFKKVKFA